MTRKALKDDYLGDYFVPAGTEIYISPYFVQRHPSLWEDPDRFNPDRFGPEHSQDRHRRAMFPFSAGPRYCIGESFARMEMQIHVMMIAKQLRLRYVQTRPQLLGDHHYMRSEEHTSELQSLTNLVCRLLLEKKKKQTKNKQRRNQSNT